MTIGIYTFELHLPTARSLKEKRQVMRRLKDRLRSRYNVSVVELEEHAGLWQRGSMAVVSIARERDALARLFEAVYREGAAASEGQIIETGSDFFEAADGGPGGWEDDWS